MARKRLHETRTQRFLGNRWARRLLNVCTIEERDAETGAMLHRMHLPFGRTIALRVFDAIVDDMRADGSKITVVRDATGGLR